MAEYRINAGKRKIEIYFAMKPSMTIRDYMKMNGWKWNPQDKYWYHFDSKKNREIAQNICYMADQKEGFSASERVKKHPVEEAPTAPALVHYTAQTSIIDSVVEFERNGIRFIGKVIAFDEEQEAVTILYTKEYSIFEEECTQIQLPYSDVRERQIYTKHEYFPGEYVEFSSSKHGLQYGVIFESVFLRDDGCESVKYYYVNTDGGIEIEYEYCVRCDRIIDYMIGMPVGYFPIKRGEKVSIEVDGKEYIGKVICCDYESDFIELEYTMYDSYGRKYEEQAFCNVEDIRKIQTKEGALRRTDYIDAVEQENIAFNEQIKHRIQTNQDQFYDAPKALSGKPLYKHQRAGCVLAEKYNRFAFFYDTGTGKTVMALNIIETKYRQKKARFLIIAPKSIIKTAWMDDAEKFFPQMHILPLYKGFTYSKKNTLYKKWKKGGTHLFAESDLVFMANVRFLGEILGIKEAIMPGKAELDLQLEHMAQHFIINSELFIQAPEEYIQRYNITGIVMDESAIMKNYNSVTAKTMRRVCEKMDYVYLLSGKPAPNNEMEFFSQMKIVAPEMFNFSYDRFLHLFCVTQGFRQILNPKNKNLFAEMVSTRSLIISKKDCLDLPETVEVIRLVELPTNIMRAYDELYFYCMTLIKGMDQSTVYYSTQSKMAVLMKLRQMASGFFMKKTDDKREQRIITDIHDAKVAEVKAILAEIPGEQVIIWCQFQHEIELLEKELSSLGVVVTAYGKTKTLEENIEAFKCGRARYILAHPKTLKYGVTFTNCRYTIYYSFSYSAEDYDQSHDRNYRLGQKESCTYFFVQAADTIDEIMYSKVMEKLSNAEFFERMVKDAAKHGINYHELKGVSDEEIASALSGVEESVAEGVIQSDKAPETKIVHTLDEALYVNAEYEDDSEPTEYQLMEIEQIFNPEKLKREPPEFGLVRVRRKYKPTEFQFNGPSNLKEILQQIPVRVSPLFSIDLKLLDLSIGETRAQETKEAGTQKTIITKDDAEDFVDFIKIHPVYEPWMIDMYRIVFDALRELPEHIREMIILRYGLQDGVCKTYTTVSDRIGYYYIDRKLCWCSPSKVSREISDTMMQFKRLIKEYCFDRYERNIRMILE